MLFLFVYKIVFGFIVFVSLATHAFRNRYLMAKTQKLKSLVIVESPAKAKTINRYLGDDYIVKASMGHVRDLPSKGINVDIENNFEPTYAISTGRRKTVTELKAALKKCDTLYLATDLDREGEAIAWHLSEILKVPAENTYRVVFNSITKKAISEAFKEPGKLDIGKIEAQQARRILDRIVGYQISPLLWKKVARGLSAGRVQSVAVKMVVEKEREIQAFDPQEYWLIPAVFSTDNNSNFADDWKKFMAVAEGEKAPTLAKQYDWLAKHSALKADLVRVDGKKFKADNTEDAHKIYDAMASSDFAVSSVETKRSKSRPTPPFITSTLQQNASTRLGFSASRTMRIAQQLYEGIDLGGKGTLGLITYMRTDSTHLSGEALESGRNYIRSAFGDEYVPEKPNFYSASKSAQAAHEAVRPTDPSFSPDEISQYLTEEQAKLYDLIWRRFVACQMTEALWDVTTIEITAKTDVGDCVYKTNGRVQVFDGFTRVWSNPSTEQQLPKLEAEQKVWPVDIEASQNFTKPPARYTEASLVKALEKEGIGRPSTYASIISTIQNRKYAEQIDRKFHSTDIGEVVTDKLSDFFPRIMDIAFTRHMEEQLDKIEEQHLNWVSVLDEFYGPFKKNLDHATEEMKHAKAETQPSEYKCPDCEAELEYRFGKNGRFLSCSKYPDCKYACPCDRNGVMLEPKESDAKCTKCDKPMMFKNGPFGQFLGCSDYPTCKTIMKIDKDGNILPPAPPAEPTGVKCHKCKSGEFVIRQSRRGPFMGCNKFPRCRNIVSAKMVEQLLEWQKEGKWPPATIEEADIMLGRKKAGGKKVAKKKVAKKKTAKKTAKKTTKKATAKKITKKSD